jgi:hypothetical protein
MEAIQSALAGEFEPLKRYGVLLNETTVQQKAMEMGLWDGVGVLDAHTRALVVNQEIFRQQPKVIGDYERTADGAANSTRELMANFKDTAAALGKELLPLGTELLKTVNSWVKGFKNLSPEMKTLIVQIGAAAAAAGPLLIVVGKLTSGLGAFLAVGSKMAGVVLDLIARWTASTAAITADTIATDKNTLSKKANAVSLTGLGAALGVVGALTAVGLELSHQQAVEANNAATAVDNLNITTEEQARQLLAAADAMDASLNATKFLGIIDTEATAAQRALAEQARETANAFLNSQVPALQRSEAVWTDYAAATRKVAPAIEAVVPNVHNAARALTRAVIEGLEPLPGEAASIGQRIPNNLAGNIRDGVGFVENVMADLTYAIKHPMAVARQVAEIEGALTGKKLGQGLQSTNPFIRTVAEQQQRLLLDRYKELTGQSYTAGRNAGSNHAEGTKDGLSQGRDEVVGAARTNLNKINSLPWYAGGKNAGDAWQAGLISGLRGSVQVVQGVLNKLRANLIGLSPPKEGPLRDIDKGGFNIGRAWIENLNKGMTGNLPALTAAGGSLTPPFSTGMAHAAAPALAHSAAFTGRVTDNRPMTVAVSVSLTSREVSEQQRHWLAVQRSDLAFR